MNAHAPTGKTSDDSKVSICEELEQVFNRHKPRFDEECSRWLDQRKQAKTQLLQDPTIVRCESSRHIRYKQKEYLKARIDVHKNISYLYTGIIDFNL